MRRYLTSIALIAETGLVIVTAYVSYRWYYATLWPGTPVIPMPYRGSFEAVLAPWIFACSFIPACFLVLSIAGWLSQSNVSR